MIRVGKYDYKTKKCPEIKGFINVIIHTSGQLSPYTMKDSKGCIMENIWQFSKIWRKMYSQCQPISQYDDRIRWKWQEENHIDVHRTKSFIDVHRTKSSIDVHETKSSIEKDILPAYYKWREAGFNHSRWVRYPNGYHHHKECIGSVYKGKIIGIVEARKKIYYRVYKKIAEKTRQFQELKKMLENGINIQICEVDGPNFLPSYPYNRTKENSLLMTPTRLQYLIENTDHAFGHGFCLAACLMDVTLDDF